MEVQAITNTATSYEQQVSTTATTIFDSLLQENRLPSKITYDEYKNLTKEQIENLYPADTMPQENKKALALHTKAHFSDDEILNEVLFDKELEFYGRESQNFVSEKVDRMLWFWDVLKEPLIVDEKHLGRANIPKSTEPIDAQTLKQIEEDKKKWEAWRKEDKPTTDFLFEVFENNKKDFIQNREYYKNSESTFRQHGVEILAIYDNIEREYEKRVAQKNEALHSYTQKSTINPLLVS